MKVNLRVKLIGSLVLTALFTSDLSVAAAPKILPLKVISHVNLGEFSQGYWTVLMKIQLKNPYKKVFLERGIYYWNLQFTDKTYWDGFMRGGDRETNATHPFSCDPGVKYLISEEVRITPACFDIPKGKTISKVFLSRTEDKFFPERYIAQSGYLGISN